MTEQPSHRIIKKYPNRRLYDTTESRYITIEAVRQLVLDRVPFKIIGTKNGEDLTHTVLLQIISEQEDSGHPVFSTEVLENVIRSYGNSMQDGMRDFLDQSMNFFVGQQQQFQQDLNRQVNQAIDTPLKVAQEITERNFEMWTQFQNSLFSTNKKDDTKDGK
ncbi:polyhydroxyalkanoate synthesis repressor PhaR [Pelagibaculum spongiae]|uniref:Polyhydroxyalkanoate synthesis repressor PhaR n=1 Tax=Pelagibaculum spongiae TaxID=2080658 RepID=A0A2V1GU12_9GAMM|nr:polyhydroxyalkanoate synthesis repressor PhaR [Pelagibaculum spongiae]PVZ68810.1 polyhydroxyalkanoate synthesis repressor PhaR [Pelagibaculum spongiae]